MDYFANAPRFSSLSLPDLLKARDQFHAHLMHKANVIGTAVGRYLIRKADPYPTRGDSPARRPRKRKPPRTLENAEVRDYSWPCVLVFVSEWVEEGHFAGQGEFSLSDYVPKTIFLEDGGSVPVCVVKAPLVETAPPPLDPADLKFPETGLSGGYPVFTQVQGATHVASIGCLVTDGHTIYALTNRHVAGRPGERLFTTVGSKQVPVGHTSDKQLGRLAFEKVYETWPGRQVYINADVGLVELDDQTRWSPSVYGLGPLGPLADLSVYNLTLNLIGCPVRAYGCASGRLSGQIAAFFYRYKAVGGFEYVADFLIGSRTDEPLVTRPGDSGTLWVVETDDVKRDRMPIAVQWGGAVFATDTARLPFALATNLSTVCRELEVDLFRSRTLAAFEYWGAVGHYTIGAFACEQVVSAQLRALLIANQKRISFKPADIDTSVNDVHVPGFVQLADVPDKVWKKAFDQQDAPYGRRGPENPNHYADLDFKPTGGQSLDQLTPNAASLKAQTWRDYYHSIGWNQVSQRGLLPFRVWQIYKRMREFVANRDLPSFVAAAGILAHYVGDACQPLHGSYLDDGDPFRHPDGSPSATMLGHGKGYGNGVHIAYEDDMLDAHVGELLGRLPGLLGDHHNMALLQGDQNAGFATLELMRRTRAHINPLDLVEAYGRLVLAGKKHQAPEALWHDFGDATLAVIADGCHTLAMLWDSAWQQGGGDLIPASDLIEFSQATLKGIYELTTFLPSKPLGQIDSQL